MALFLGACLGAASSASPGVLLYATYFGGAEDDIGHAIAVDEAGNILVAGQTASPDFPVTPGAYDQQFDGLDEGFVAKFNATGSVQYVTYFGGSESDRIVDMVVDRFGNAYIAGSTTSLDLPTTACAYARNHSGNVDVFVAKVRPDGTELFFATYLGGSGRDEAVALDIDASGSVYVTGWTTSQDFPVTPGAYAPSFLGVSATFVSKLSPDGQSLVYATYLGGVMSDLPHDLAVDGSGSAVVVGSANSEDFPVTSEAYDTTANGQTDVFVVKLNPTGTELVFGTYLGGGNLDLPQAVAVDGLGEVYVTGSTYSDDFPTTGDALATSPRGGRFDAFVSRFDALGASLLYSTFLGGDESEDGFGIAVDESGNVFVAGSTSSGNFPITSDALASYSGGGDAYVARFGAGGRTLSYATYIGGSQSDLVKAVAIDAAGNVYLTGTTESTDFAVTPDAYGANFGGIQDAIVLKLRPPAAPSGGEGPVIPEPLLLIVAIGVGGGAVAAGLILWHVRRKGQPPT